MENLPPDRPHVVVNMVTTLDGRASLHGNTKNLGSQADTEHLVSLRTRFDAVMIGAGTMRAERYGRIISRPEFRKQRQQEGLAADALAVILSSSLDLPFDAPLFTDGNGNVLLFSHQTDLPETRTPTELVTIDGPIRVAEVLTQLRREKGVESLLCEGGPHLFGQLLAENLVDELYLTVTPVAIGGDAPRILEANLPETARFELLEVKQSQGDLFAHYRRT